MKRSRLILGVVAAAVVVAIGIYLAQRAVRERGEAPPVAQAPAKPAGEPSAVPPMTPIPTPPRLPAGGGEAVKKLMERPFPENLDQASRDVERDIREAYKQTTGMLPQQVAASMGERDPESRRKMLETCKELERQNREVPQRYADSLAEWKRMEKTAPEEAQKAKGGLYMSLYLNRLNHEYCKGILRQ
ncbi:MAG: hypothetical protein HYT87_07945 [Nitrospirae bacterium]|nr:hypothetical protein [Nitrospirota bacterium]